MADESEDVLAIQRREAQSGRVSYSDAVVLHESSKRRVVLIPFYIHRTSGTDLAVKITTYLKADPPLDWVISEEKSISLNESASRNLLKSLRQHLVLANENDDGNYLVVRVTEGTAQLGEHDPVAVASALTKVLSQEEIVKHLYEAELSGELISALRGAIRLQEMKSAVSTLRQHLDDGETSEEIYRKWCEQHTWAFGNAYIMRDSVREISPGDHLDLLLPTVISGFRDIVELKRPDMSVIHEDAAHRNWYFSSETSKAIGQCHRYLDVLHEVAAKGLRDHPEVVAYHPRAIIVIGRSNGWSNDQRKALHGLNTRLSGITIMTYDQLLAQGERLVEMLSAKVDDVGEDEADLETLSGDP